MTPSEYFDQHVQLNAIYAPNKVQFADICRGYGLNPGMQFYVCQPADMIGLTKGAPLFVYKGDNNRPKLLEAVLATAEANHMKVVNI